MCKNIFVQIFQLFEVVESCNYVSYQDKNTPWCMLASVVHNYMTGSRVHYIGNVALNIQNLQLFPILVQIKVSFSQRFITGPQSNCI